jgi:hypothetical protein
MKKMHRKAKIPAIFSDNPELHRGFRSFCIDSHNNLTLETIQNYIITTGIQALVNTINHTTHTGPHITADLLLQQYNLNSVSKMTVSRDG